MFFRLLAVFLSLAIVIASSVPAFAKVKRTFQETSAAEFAEVEKLRSRKPDGRLKLGLALGGGGGRGSAHIGVLKVLDKAGLKFDYICGTSIGSVIGGLYASGGNPKEMEKYFVDGMHHFMTVPLWTRIAVAPVMFMPRVVGFHPYDGLYRGNKFRKYVVKGMSKKERQIENMKTPFGAVVLSILDGKPYIIRRGDFGYAIQASCAVPSLRKPVEIDGQLFCDGGVVCNLPVKQCREMGADFVIAVNIDEPFKVEKLRKFRKAGSVSKRMLTWALYATDAPQEAMADVLIHPFTEGISLLSAKKSDAKHGFRSGEKAALKALPLIKEKLAKYEIEVKDVDPASLNPEESEEDVDDGEAKEEAAGSQDGEDTERDRKRHRRGHRHGRHGKHRHDHKRGQKPESSDAEVDSEKTESSDKSEDKDCEASDAEETSETSESSENEADKNESGDSVKSDTTED